MGVHWKICFSVEGFTKKQYIGENCIKRGTWTICRLKGGLAKKEGVVFLRGKGGWYPNAQYVNVFDLTPPESLQDKFKKISQLFCIFGEDTIQDVEEEWFGFKVKLTYKKRWQFSEHELLNQFNLSYKKIVSLLTELRRRTNENRCHEAKTYATQTMVKIFERYGYAVPRLLWLDTHHDKYSP